MQIVSPFNAFDPETGGIPLRYPLILEHIAKKARSILNNRSKNEIEYALQSINWMLYEAAAKKERKIIQNHENDNLSKIEEMVLIQQSDLITPAELLNLVVEEFDIGNQEQFPNANWADYFAVLSLALVGNAAELQIGETSGIHDAIVLGALTTEAMQALCYAEQLPHGNAQEKVIASAVKMRISLKNQAAAIKRHAELNEIKRRFIAFYEDGEFPSVADAARKFFKTLDADEQRVLNPSLKIENAVRTLQQALREHKL